MKQEYMREWGEEKRVQHYNLEKSLNVQRSLFSQRSRFDQSIPEQRWLATPGLLDHRHASRHLGWTHLPGRESEQQPRGCCHCHYASGKPIMCLCWLCLCCMSLVCLCRVIVDCVLVVSLLCLGCVLNHHLDYVVIVS